MSPGAFWRWLADSLGALLPGKLRLWIAGPAGKIDLKEDGFSSEGVSRARLCDVVVDEACVLRRSFSFPAEALRELRSAVDLQIETSTPFEPSELIMGMRLSPIEQDPSQQRVEVAAVPLALLDRALNATNVTRRQVRSITTGSAPFQRLELPGRTWRWPTILSGASLAVLALLWGASAAMQLESARNTAASLRANIEDVRHRTTELVEELDRRTVATAAANPAGQSSGVIPSVTAALLAFSAARPPSAEVLRIEVRSDGMRVGLRAQDVMTAVSTLQSGLPEWEVTAEGGITVDAATNSEISTALMRPKP